MRARHHCFGLIAALWAGAFLPSALGAAGSGGDAATLYRITPATAARTALERLAAAEPKNAPARYYLGLTLMHQGGPTAFAAAAPWLKQATELDPQRAAYFADYGGVCMKLANQHQSLDWALKGRDALERAAALDPGDLASREILVQFYGQAPWPVGNTMKARAHAGEIGRRDPRRGARAWVMLGRLLEKKSEVALAKSSYQKALDLAPGDPDARQALARLGVKP